MPKKIYLTCQEFLFLHTLILDQFDTYLGIHSKLESHKDIGNTKQLYGYSNYDRDLPNILAHMKMVVSDQDLHLESRTIEENLRGKYLYDILKECKKTSTKEIALGGSFNIYPLVYFNYVGLKNITEFREAFEKHKKSIPVTEFIGYKYFYTNPSENGIFQYILNIYELTNTDSQFKAELIFEYPKAKLQKQYSGTAVRRGTYITMQFENNLSDPHRYYSLVLHSGMNIELTYIWRGTLTVISKTGAIVSGEIIFLKKENDLIDAADQKAIRQYILHSKKSMSIHAIFSREELSTKSKSDFNGNRLT